MSAKNRADLSSISEVS